MQVVIVLLSVLCACAHAGVPYYGGVSKGTPATSKSYRGTVVNRHNGGYDHGYPLDYGKGLYQAVKPVYGARYNGGYGNRAAAYAESQRKGMGYDDVYSSAYGPVYDGAYGNGNGYVRGYGAGYGPVNGAAAHAASVGNGRAYAAAGRGSYYGAPGYGPGYVNGYGAGYGKYGVY